MKKLALSIAITLSTLSTSGCMMQVGEDEFSCPYNGKGAACSSARQIHNLTNNRNNLEGLNVSNGKILDSTDTDFIEDANDDHAGHNHPIVNTESPAQSADNYDYEIYETPFGNVTDPKEKAFLTLPGLADNGRAKDEMYEPIGTHRYDTLPAAESIPEPKNRTFGAVEGLESEHGQLMVHRQSPMALAPEPLAILQQPKTMRILVASWIDDAGDLHMPGYVYVEVEPKKWLVGGQANKRPGRIVPLQIQKKTQEEERRQNKAKKGYSSLGIIER